MRWVDGTTERIDSVPKRTVGFWCANRHHTEHDFAADVLPPALWDCPRCGLPAGQDEENPPAPPTVEPYKTHLAYVKERRTDEEAAALLDDALTQLRTRRGQAPKA